ncbi:MAG: oligopeptide/dipeptide ABC transporter ATP-binding protein [Caldimonas sp.]|nr:ATP-binding cassette domain-containing protein [Pseudomonadota bacterium]
MRLLEVERLTVEFRSAAATLVAVDDVSFSVDAGEVVGIVGESGSGKSVTALATLGLVDEPGRVRAERMSFDGHDLQTMPARERRSLLGADIAMIFQDPTSSLNPSFSVAFQLMETIALHEGGSRKARRARALQLLKDVEIPDAERRLDAFPHQLSGGMSQRVMLAMAIACNPRLLIADEPTTALDVTIQAQMLALLLRLQRQHDMALVLITHDLGVVAEVAERVIVMYAGQVVETAAVPAVFEQPRHPYTEALLASLPERNPGQRRLRSLAGVVPGAFDRPPGCLLSPRCPYVQARCRQERPPLFELGAARARCFFPLPSRTEVEPR